MCHGLVLNIVFISSQSLIAFAKLKRQVLLCEPAVKNLKEFNDGTQFWVNQDFAVM